MKQNIFLLWLNVWQLGALCTDEPALQRLPSFGRCILDKYTFGLLSWTQWRFCASYWCTHRHSPTNTWIFLCFNRLIIIHSLLRWNNDNILNITDRMFSLTSFKSPIVLCCCKMCFRNSFDVSCVCWEATNHTLVCAIRLLPMSNYLPHTFQVLFIGRLKIKIQNQIYCSNQRFCFQILDNCQYSTNLDHDSQFYFLHNTCSVSAVFARFEGTVS